MMRTRLFLRLANTNARHISTTKTSLPPILTTTSRHPTTSTSSIKITQQYYPFSTTSGGGNDNNNDNDKPKDDEDDPFGLNYHDGPDNLGTTLPPRYKRDPSTGKLTGDTERELSPEDDRLAKMTAAERMMELERKLASHWSDDHEDKIADRIRREEMGLNVLGRGPSVHPAAVGDEEEEVATSSAPLTEEEYRTFKRYLETTQPPSSSDDSKKPPPLTRDDIRVGDERDATIPPDYDPDRSLSWLSKATNSSPDAWMDDILPADMSPIAKLNRRQAKPLPKKILHQNHLELLRRYVTPGGQIVNRRYSRLGAKDQRKIAKFIKRSRQMGLIPYIGQWKLVDEGDKIKDLGEDDNYLDWEVELEKRGFDIYGRRGRGGSEE